MSDRTVIVRIPGKPPRRMLLSEWESMQKDRREPEDIEEVREPDETAESVETEEEDD